MKKAQKEGVAFAAVLKLATQAYAAGLLNVKLVATSELNEKTRRELVKMSKDIKGGRNLSPAFTNVRDAIAYLKSN